MASGCRKRSSPTIHIRVEATYSKSGPEQVHQACMSAWDTYDRRMLAIAGSGGRGLRKQLASNESTWYIASGNQRTLQLAQLSVLETLTPV